MKVFGIGLSRTGTKSLTAALRTLGYHVVHYPKDAVTAREVLHGLPYSLLARCDGLTDIHAAVCFRDLDARFPRSRFILTTRDKDAWLGSCERHFARVRPETYPPPIGDMMLALRLRMYGVDHFDAGTFSLAYDRHHDQVRGHFKERADLLELDIPGGDGWNKLCAYLGHPITARRFPWVV